MPKAKFVLDTNVKSVILRKIASEVAKIGGTVALDSYYKDPNGGGGGVYGKGDNPVFGKSDPPKSIDAIINVATRAQIAESVVKVDNMMRKARRR